MLRISAGVPIPSIGFAYLVAIALAFVGYIAWVAEEGWYEKSPSGKDVALSLAEYIEKIVDDFPEDRQQQLRQEQLMLFERAGSAGANDVLLAMGMISEQQAILTTLLSDDARWDSTQQDIDAILASELALDSVTSWRPSLRLMALDFISRHASASEIYPVLERIWQVDSRVQTDTEGGFSTAGVEPDGWILRRGPGLILVDGSRGSKATLTLGVYAKSGDYPITISVEAGSTMHEVVIGKFGNVRLDVPLVSPKVNLFRITTSKYWKAEADHRRFGVRIVNVDVK